MSFIERFGIAESAALARPAAAGFAATAASAAFDPAAARRRAGTVFIEVGESAQKANVTRDGIDVPVVKLRPDILGDILRERPQVVTKVVSQSLAPGTRVPVGTTVDIVLAPPGDLPIRVVEGIHLGLQQLTVTQVFDQLVNNRPDVVNVLARNPSASTLTDADKAVLRNAASGVVDVTDQPGNDVNAVFNSVQAAFTLRG